MTPELQAKIDKAKETAIRNKTKGKIQYVKSKYRILSLDVSTYCGWAVSQTIFGCWDLSIKRDESSGMRMLRFKAKLMEVIEAERINLVSFERSAGAHKAAIIIQSELHGVLKLLLEELEIEYRAFSAKEIKKFATGNGNAPKSLMISSAKQKYGYTGDNDNEADALHIFHLTKHDLGI